jgi:hypothetical protein
LQEAPGRRHFSIGRENPISSGGGGGTPWKAGGKSEAIVDASPWGCIWLWRFVIAGSMDDCNGAWNGIVGGKGLIAPALCIVIFDGLEISPNLFLPLSNPE